MIFMASKSFEKDKSIKLKKEKWFKTKYSAEKFSPELIEKLDNPNIDTSEKQLGLPPKNPFVPEHLVVMSNQYDGKTRMI